MTEASPLHFRKMNGLGNDFVVFDARQRPIAMDEAKARAIANRKTGIGCDQLIVIEPSRKADVTMRIWNNEGEEVESCGNATRCIADVLFAEKNATRATIDTKGGFLVAEKGGDLLVTVDMGAPRFDWQDIPLSQKFHDTRYIDLFVGPVDAPLIDKPSVVNVGNPHCIFWVKDLDVVDLARVGPMLEHHGPHPGLRHGGLRRDGGGLPPQAAGPQGHRHAAGRRSLHGCARKRRPHHHDRPRDL